MNVPLKTYLMPSKLSFLHWMGLWLAPLNLHSNAGCFVISNASAWRMAPDVPLIIPEINASAMALLGDKPQSGLLQTQTAASFHSVWPWHPCTTLLESRQPLSAPIKPFLAQVIWRIRLGHGWNRPPACRKRGAQTGGRTPKILSAEIDISARCVRVPVADGHLLGVNLKLSQQVSPEAAMECLSAGSQNSSTPLIPKPCSSADDAAGPSVPSV